MRDLGYAVLGLLVIGTYYLLLFLLLFYMPTGQAFQLLGSLLGGLGTFAPFVFVPLIAVKGSYGKITFKGCLAAAAFAVIAIVLSGFPLVGWILTILLSYWFGKGLVLMWKENGISSSQ